MFYIFAHAFESENIKESLFALPHGFSLFFCLESENFFESKNNETSFFSASRQAIYRNLFLLPFAFYPQSNNGKHTTPTTLATATLLTQTTTFLSSPSAFQHFDFPHSHHYNTNTPCHQATHSYNFPFCISVSAVETFSLALFPFSL